jgi:hypothetical protein
MSLMINRLRVPNLIELLLASNLILYIIIFYFFSRSTSVFLLIYTYTITAIQKWTIAGENFRILRSIKLGCIHWRPCSLFSYQRLFILKLQVLLQCNSLATAAQFSSNFAIALAVWIGARCRGIKKKILSIFF